MNLSLSIVIPVYNLEKYIGKCIKSLQSQISCFENVKVYIVNDGSQDQSEKVIQSLIQEDNHFIYLCKENGGVSSARNYALSYINTDFVTFLDGDDFVSDDYIKTLDENLTKNCQLLCFDYNRVTDSEVLPNVLNLKNEVLQLEPHYGLYGFLDFKLQNFIRPFVWNKVFRVDIIKNFNLRFDEQKRIGEDTIFTTAYLEKINEMKLLDKSLYNYIERTGSTMRRYNEYHLDESIEYFRCFREIAEANDLDIDNHYLLAYYISRWFGMINNEAKGPNFQYGITQLDKFLKFEEFREHKKEIHFNKLTFKLKCYLILINLGMTKLIYLIMFILNKFILIY